MASRRNNGKPTEHPALLPGLGVERTSSNFGTSWGVFAFAAVLVAVVIIWGATAPRSLATASSTGLAWVSGSFGWLFGLLTCTVFAFMMWLGFGRYRNIRLGQDDEQPEFSTGSWLAMLFSAGIGIGLLFYGPYEPMTYFLDLPPAYENLDPGTNPAMHSALVQTLFHWGPMAWAYYALVGGAVAYAAYRKGRTPLISSLLEPIFGDRTKGPLGAVVDSFAIIVTLFGVAVSLGIGALQIGRGVEIVAGTGPLGNGAIIGIITVLTVAFIISAVSGVKRGIRALSNINMVVAGLLGVFVFVVGPTAFLLNLFQGTLMQFVGDSFRLMAQTAATSPDAQAFMDSWTTYYWAWWVSWTPFVGLFIARISRGRTLREFVTTVIVTPSVVCLVWFTILGGTSMWMEQANGALSSAESPQDMLFALLHQLPAGTFTSIVAMVSIVIFFVTSADSGSVVMASLSQRGNPNPSSWVTIVWGIALAAIAAVLLVGGGSVALNGLQSLVIITALPFALVVILVMIAWGKDLARDPQTLRRRYAREAIVQGVRTGIEKHGDDFVVGVVRTEGVDNGAGAWLDSEDPALTEWYRPEETELPTNGSGSVDPTADAGEPEPVGSR
ncbi:BCCT family transporter [Promicromonospora iranensis]|uniref:BCCT family transporter n=1 Tax=Promicromonospora iranensis TaxID=1105144 RepID=UPI0023A91F4F|nr:BCCT family transporter [Promicromonospora iranensis]